MSLIERDTAIEERAQVAGAPRWLFSPQEEAALNAMPAARGRCAPMPSSGMVFVMKATRNCNLRCTYCHSWRTGDKAMAFEVMAATTWDALSAPNVTHADFVWHGGEVTLLKPAFFEKAVAVQRLFKRCDQRVTNGIQTNATLISDEWIDFWKRFDFSVGVSVDGAPEIHDAKRIDRKGRGSWARVAAGMRALHDGGVRFGALAVICEATVKAGSRAFLDQISDLGVKGVALLNVIPQTSGALTDDDEWLRFDRFTSFLCDLYETWNASYRASFDIREFSSLENNLAGLRPVICVHSARCVGKFLTIEPNGDVGPCDKFDGDARFRFGNILNESCSELLAHSENFQSVSAQEDALKGAMRDCRHAAVCAGGCVHDALVKQLYAGSGAGACCGLAPLIETIATAQGGSNGKGSLTRRRRVRPA